MRYYINPLKLRLARTWIYNDGEQGCCRVAVKFGLFRRTWGTSGLMSPGEADRELSAMQHALYQGGYWPLWFYLLCCGAYVFTAIQLLYSITR